MEDEQQQQLLYAIVRHLQELQNHSDGPYDSQGLEVLSPPPFSLTGAQVAVQCLAEAVHVDVSSPAFANEALPYSLPSIFQKGVLALEQEADNVLEGLVGDPRFAKFKGALAQVRRTIQAFVNVVAARLFFELPRGLHPVQAAPPISRLQVSVPLRRAAQQQSRGREGARSSAGDPRGKE